ncbi:hypothetical protein A2U01_0076820, partial [Trifolium medium]|nr:hypothetical protein [Trifolium medium]
AEIAYWVKLHDAVTAGNPGPPDPLL